MNIKLHIHSIRSCALTVATCLVVGSITGPLFGQSDPCALAMKDGLYNHYKEKILIHKNFKWKDYFKSKQFRQDVSNHSWGVGVTIPIYGVPVGVDANSSNSDFNKFSSQIEKLSERQIEELLTREVERSEPNVEFAKAYFKCIADENGWSSSSELQGGRVFFTIRFRPISTTDRMPVVKDVKVNEATDISVLPKRGKALDYVTTISAKPKNPETAVTVEMYTDHGAAYAAGPLPIVAPSLKSLAQQIQDGAKFEVVMSSLRKHIGTIRPGSVLYGIYRPSGYVWDVWSPHHPTAPNKHFLYGFPGTGTKPGTEIKRSGSGPRDPMKNQLCLWGAVFTFDEHGKVYHAQQKAAPVGDLTIRH